MVLGIAIWMTAVVIAETPSATFKLFVFLGWGIALIGVLLHFVAFYRAK